MIDNSEPRAGRESKLNGYKAFYKGKSIDVYAETTYEAQKSAAKVFKAKHSWEVDVILCERADGSIVNHSTSEL